MELRLSGCSLKKKFNSQNAVLTDDKLDKTGAILEHPPHKSLTQLAQQTQVSTITASTATKMLSLWLYETRQLKQTIGEKNADLRWFLRAEYDGIFYPKLVFFPNKSWPHMSWYGNAHDSRYQRSMNPGQTF
jgi:hypothetical protein